MNDLEVKCFLLYIIQLHYLCVSSFFAPLICACFKKRNSKKNPDVTKHISMFEEIFIIFLRGEGEFQQHIFGYLVTESGPYHFLLHINKKQTCSQLSTYSNTSSYLLCNHVADLWQEIFTQELVKLPLS